MSDIAELERRITAALERIGSGLDRLASAPAGVAPAAEEGEALGLREALEEERTVNAQLAERLRALKEKDGEAHATLSARVEQLTRQLDTQGLELQRLRKTTVQLREQLRTLRETQEGAVDPHLINKSMLAELEALRAARAAETQELDEILSELAPIIEEAKADA
jgi:chromosome segregation ATPase